MDFPADVAQLAPRNCPLTFNKCRKLKLRSASLTLHRRLGLEPGGGGEMGQMILSGRRLVLVPLKVSEGSRVHTHEPAEMTYGSMPRHLEDQVKHKLGDEKHVLSEPQQGIWTRAI